MQIQQQKYYVGILLFGICLFYPSLVSPCCSTIHTCSSISNTELNINRVVLSYKIHPFGEYSCGFTLEILGNSFTAKGDLHGEFIIYGFPIENFTLSVLDVLVEFTKTDSNNYSNVAFSSDTFTIPDGTPFEIKGGYNGKFITNTSNIYSFELGVDWGCIVESQQTDIHLKNYYTILTAGMKPGCKINMSNQIISWLETNVQDFQTQLVLQKTTDAYLVIHRDPWNATRGDVYDLPFQNDELFPIEGRILCPAWITKNTTYFQLDPTQKVCLHFEINSQASLGMIGDIEIIINLNSTFAIQRSYYEILIPVRILQDAFSEQLLPFIEIATILTLIGLLGVIIYKKDSLQSLTPKFKQIVNHFQNSNLFSSWNSESVIDLNSEEKEFQWQVIQSKWETILSENELKVIKILYTEGVMNQKALAEELDLTPMSISRIISRLETKRLVIRKPLGMSKMIKLRKDHL